MFSISSVATLSSTLPRYISGCAGQVWTRHLIYYFPWDQFSRSPSFMVVVLYQKGALYAAQWTTPSKLRSSTYCFTFLSRIVCKFISCGFRIVTTSNAPPPFPIPVNLALSRIDCRHQSGRYIVLTLLRQRCSGQTTFTFDRLTNI